MLCHILLEWGGVCSEDDHNLRIIICEGMCSEAGKNTYSQVVGMAAAYEVSLLCFSGQMPANCQH
jgi:hypothetical protein